MELPENMQFGEYDIYLGAEYGGAEILYAQAEGETVVCGQVMMMRYGRPLVTNGKLWDVRDLQRMFSLKEKESVTELAYPCLIAEMEVENEGKTTSYWGVYFAEEGCDIYYLMQFSMEYFTKEQVLDILNTVKFADRAFY